LSVSHADPEEKTIAYRTSTIDVGDISALAVADGVKKYGMDVMAFSSLLNPARQSQQMDDAIRL
jgi:hypothetical protein